MVLQVFVDSVLDKLKFSRLISGGDLLKSSAFVLCLPYTLFDSHILPI